MPRILLTQPIHQAAHNQLERLGAVVVASDIKPDTLREQACGCEVVVVRAPLPEDIFEAADSLVGAVRHGAGVDMIPIEQATRRGVLVANVPGANARSVAEHVLGSMLQLARRHGFMARRLQTGAAGWAQARALAESGFELAGRTVGVVGYGNVGQAIAALCQALSMTVLAAARDGAPQGDARAEQVPLPQLLARSDFLVLACPLTPQTRGLVGHQALTSLKPGSFVVNAARGAVVQEAALLEGLASGHIAGAALDVFDTVPLPPEHPFWTMEQVLLTPHVAGISGDSMLRMGAGVAAAVERLLRGDMPQHCVNPQAYERFRLRVASARKSA